MEADGVNGYGGWGLYHEFNFVSVPGDVTNVSVSDHDDSGFKLTWDEPQDTLPTGYSYSYKIEYDTNNNFSNSTDISGVDTVNGFTVDNVNNTVSRDFADLSSNTLYYFKIYAANGDDNNGTFYYGGAHDSDGEAVLTKPADISVSATESNTSITFTIQSAAVPVVATLSFAKISPAKVISSSKTSVSKTKTPHLL